MKLIMNNLKLLCPKELYQEGNLTLWSNKYIANNVIKKHLNESIDSGTRKFITVKKTVDWLSDMLPGKAQILDIGCGPGIYAPLFCERGFLYDGIDISSYQIEYAKKHNYVPNKTNYNVCDFRKWNSKKKYEVCLLLYGIYSFYSPNERIAFLKKIKQIIKEDGFVVIELFTKNHYLHRDDSTDWSYIEKNGFWSKYPYLELNSFHKYKEESVVLIQAAIIRKSISVWNSWIALFDKESIYRELSLAGFKNVCFYGSCYGLKYYDDTEVICVVAK